MIEKVVWVVEASISRTFVLCLEITTSRCRSPLNTVGLAVVEDDDFVDAKDRGGSRDLCG